MNRTQALIKGLQILSKYEDCDVQADHDIIFAGPESHRDVDDHDAHELEQLGWYVLPSFHCWAFNV
jgi:hypothetical protein